jgi:hypothetical protein
MHPRRFATFLGGLFIVVGIMGFLPGFTVHHMDDSLHLMVTGPGTGRLLNLFHVNLLHNLVHILFGVLGIVMARTGSAIMYCRIVSVVYLLLAIMGMIPTANTWHTWGLVPIEGHDVWLHLVIALVAGWVGWFVDQTLPTATPEIGTETQRPV